jgi:hypothetical protein
MAQELQAQIEAAKSGVALYDRTAWGRIQVSDADRINFLHNQSSNDFKVLKPGEGCDTVFLTSTARTIDLATAYILDDSVILFVSPGLTEKLMTFLDRYIFFADKVKLTDITQQTAALSLLGAQSHAVLEKLGAAEIIGKPDAQHQVFPINGQEVRVAVGSGLAIEGYTLITDANYKIALQNTLFELGVKSLDDHAWEHLRIEQGRPMPGHELTDDYNPLEAGLWHTISFNKGCYIGQETIARLETYKGVKQQLWGVKLSAPVEAGAVIHQGDEKIGILTSAIETLGLGYIRTKAGGVGLQVSIADVSAEIVEVPYLTHEKQN